MIKPHSKWLLFILTIMILSCQSKQETIKPIVQSITESIYASGMVISENQYTVFSTVSGVVDEVYVEAGDLVEAGSPMLIIGNEAQKIMLDNAKLSSDYNGYKLNQGKLQEAKALVELSKKKKSSDSLLLKRQQDLWAQNIGSKFELEQRELAYQNALTNFKSAKEKYDDLEKMLKYQAAQTKNNLLISRQNNSDYLVKSRLKGKVYQVNLSKGDLVTPQIPIAIVGDDEAFTLVMQVDEYDIVDIQLGMTVMITLNSHKDSVYQAVVSKINPLMNVQSKTFTIEATFTKRPNVLYPNVSFEANILLRTKKDALLVPRNYLLNDSITITAKGDRKVVKTGLKDFKMIEILSGINKDEALILPGS